MWFRNLVLGIALASGAQCFAQGFTGEISGPELMAGPRVQDDFGTNLVWRTPQELARAIVDHTNRDVVGCGLYLMNPYSPGLPFPMVPAEIAIVNRQGRLLAYVDDENTYPEAYVYKNPDGSMRHVIYFDMNSLALRTPFRNDVIARMQYDNVVKQYRYACGFQEVTKQAFYECVDHQFVRVISGQLCRFAL